MQMEVSQPCDINAQATLAALTPDSVLLDVRTPEEYAAGRLPGSVNVPLDALQTIDQPLDAPLFVYCRSGRRSALAVAQLLEMGYTDVRNIGGILDWDGPVETDETP